MTEITREDVVEAMANAWRAKGYISYAVELSEDALKAIEDMGAVIMPREATETERRAVIDAMDNPTIESPQSAAWDYLVARRAAFAAFQAKFNGEKSG